MALREEQYSSEDEPVDISAVNDSDFDDDDEEEMKNKVFSFKPKTKTGPTETLDDEEESDNEGEELDEDASDQGDAISENEDEEVAEVPSKSTNKKLKKLTAAQLEKDQKRIRRTGVCYLSRIPPYMKPSKLRSVLSRFGAIDRLFLKPEDSAIHNKRVKYGGNKKKNFTEGWAEFVKKSDAKLCADTLNGNKLGGKKGSYYYDDVMNIKYLHGFKWLDLTQQIARENEAREAKLAMELSQQQKLNKSFIQNVEQSKVISTIQRKRQAKSDSNDKKEEEGIRRNFKQRKVESTRSAAKDEIKEKSKPNEKLNDILSKVF
ncbi:Pre-rRNA-processing protein ESF2 [Spathaspora sp. JA1]|nr:Pre-rRNA-processing protein ESF2 [Spathaspora sp. JA1]